MTTHRFFSASLSAEHIDSVNGILRGVSVLTSGLIARGHDLEVDQVTLRQMHACAQAKKQVPVKVDHKSGAAAVCGFLTNFKIVDTKLVADWHLLATHPQRDQILEVAQRMPRGVGLSASFVSPDNGERGKARVAELISVDYVTLPAANPDGMFSAKTRERPLTGVQRLDNVLVAARRGAETGALTGVAARALIRRRGLNSGKFAATGALIGAGTNGALQYLRDKPRRDLAARVATIMLQEREQLRRLTNAVGSHVSFPGADEVEAVGRIVRKPLIRRVGARLLKIGAGSAAGWYIGGKIGPKAGAVAGAVAGALFESRDVRSTVRMSINHAKKVTNL